MIASRAKFADTFLLISAVRRATGERERDSPQGPIDVKPLATRTPF